MMFQAFGSSANFPPYNCLPDLIQFHVSLQYKLILKKLFLNVHRSRFTGFLMNHSFVDIL